jgi:hypothetical protein
MNDLWITGVRLAGVCHFVTLTLACLTPIPPGWAENLARLPDTHRRFAVAQNVFIGGVIAFGGVLCLAVAPDLVSGTPLARAACAGLALWWGGRLVVLPWLHVGPHLRGRWLRAGFVALVAECAAFAVTFGWLTVR